LSGYFAAFAKHDHGRYADDPKSRRKTSLFLGIDLTQPDIRFQKFGRLSKRSGHHLAWSAPRGPKIHYQWNVAAGGVKIKVFGCKNERLAGK
jgi:hypothetical protein